MFGDRRFSLFILSLMGTGALAASPTLDLLWPADRETRAIAKSLPPQVLIAQAPEASPPEESQENSPPKPIAELKLGDQGEIVEELQRRLKQLGHYEGELNGNYDEQTQEAVAKFQRSQDLEPTGVFDEKAFDRLREIQNISTPRRRQRRPRRIRRRTLAIIGAAGLLFLTGLAGGIFFLYRYINRSRSVDLEGMEEEEEGYILEEEAFADEDGAFANNSTSPDNHYPTAIAAKPEEEKEKPLKPLYPTPKHRQPETVKEKPVPSETIPQPPAPEIPAPLPVHDYFAAIDPLDEPPPLSTVQLDPIEELIRELHSPNPDKRKQGIWELAQRADSRAVQPLVGLLLESDSQQQSLILEALSQIGTRTLKPMNRALALSLQDDNAQVRKNAIRDLTRMYELIAQLSQLIYYATDDPDPEVQETAKWALGQLSHIRMQPERTQP